jgi:hypothetical protein
MGSTAHLFLHPNYHSLLRQAGSQTARMTMVENLRKGAINALAEAVKRVPVEKPSIVEAYTAKGLRPVWMLDDNDDAIRFCFALKGCNPTPAELEASNVLHACVTAQEAGDVPEFAVMDAGINAPQLAAQAVQKKFKDSGKTGGKGRSDRYAPLRKWIVEKYAAYTGTPNQRRANVLKDCPEDLRALSNNLSQFIAHTLRVSEKANQQSQKTK